MSDNDEEAEAEAESASCASAEDLVNDERSPKSAVIEIDFGRGRRGEVIVRRGDDAHALALQFVCDYGLKDSALSKVESHIRETLAELSFISDRESEAEGCWALDVTMDSTTEQQQQQQHLQQEEQQQHEQPELVDLSAIAESETAASAAEMAAEAAEAAAAAAAEREASLLSELASLYGELVRTRTEQASIASALASALQDAADMRASLEAAEKAALHSDESKAATLEIAALRRKVATLQMQLMQLTDKSRGGGGDGGGDDDDDGNSADAKRNELLSMIKNL